MILNFEEPIYHSNDSLEDTNESYIVNYEPFLKLSGIICLHEVIDLVISSQILVQNDHL